MLFLYYGQFEHFSYCENWVADAIDRSGNHCVRVRRTPWFDEQLLLKIARDHQATHLLLSKTPEITADQLQTIKSAGIKIVFWTFDWMRHPEAWAWYEPLARVADVCFQTDGYDPVGYSGILRRELHQGIVPGLHELPRFEFPDWEPADLTFIGSNYTARRHELIDRLDHAPDFPTFEKWGEPGPQVWGDQFANVAHYSKIVVGDNFVNDVPGYWSDRVYLTLGCGGFFLTAYVPGLEYEFENHKQLVWWNTWDELRDLIRHYLPRESARKKIALNGYRTVHVRDTYDLRVAQMCRVLEDRA